MKWASWVTYACTPLETSSTLKKVAWVGSSRRSSEYLNLRPYVVPVLSS